VASPQPLAIQTWPIDRLVFYARNPRKKRRSHRSQVQQHPGVRFQDPDACPQCAVGFENSQQFAARTCRPRPCRATAFPKRLRTSLSSTSVSQLIGGQFVGRQSAKESYVHVELSWCTQLCISSRPQITDYLPSTENASSTLPGMPPNWL